MVERFENGRDKMIVSELIEKLKQMPQDARVLVDGYEQDWTEPDSRAPRQRLIHLDYYQPKPDYCGEHVDCGGWKYRGKNQLVPEWACWPCLQNVENKIDKPPVWVVLIER